MGVKNYAILYEIQVKLGSKTLAQCFIHIGRDTVMQFREISIFVLLLLTFGNGEAEELNIKYNAPLEKNDTQKDYFIILLNEMCQQLSSQGHKCNLRPVKLPMLQQRQLKSLNKELIDVVWTVTTKERENNYLPIRIPLMDGLIGYRLAVVNKSNRQYFNLPLQIESLKKLRLAQGHDWPDTVILRNNGFNVIETAWYNKLYKQTSLGYFDYTLRGVLEVYSEFDKFSEPNVYIDENLLFRYPSAIYFFVKKGNVKLADYLTQALSALKKSGEFDNLLREFKNHKVALERANLEKRVIIDLDNDIK